MFRDSDILLCRGRGIVPSLIQWGTGSEFSHVAVIASAKLGLIIEAVPEGGVRAIAVENYRTDFALYRVKPGFTFDAAGVAAFLIKTLARKYDFGSAVKLGWEMTLRKLKLLQLFGLKVTGNHEAASRLQEDQDYFCSELCYEAFFVGGGLDIVPQIGDAEVTSPGDIARSPVLEEIKLSKSKG